jgi:hypothetical protein
MQEGRVAREITISDLKRNFMQEFPDSPLTPILLCEPDSMSVDELIAKTGTWLAFLQQKKGSRK